MATAAGEGEEAGIDADSQRWLSALGSAGQDRDGAVADLHALLLRAARFEVNRRRPSLSFLGPTDLDDLAVQAAGDATVAVLARLGSFRGASRFTTWAYKFAIYETSVKLRRRAWHGREIPAEEDAWGVIPDSAAGPDSFAEYGELLAAVREGIGRALTPHQRRVLVALALEGVPIDVLAERLGTTRGALYKALHDARQKLRGHLAARGLTPTATPKEA